MLQFNVPCNVLMFVIKILNNSLACISHLFERESFKVAILRVIKWDIFSVNTQMINGSI